MSGRESDPDTFVFSELQRREIRTMSKPVASDVEDGHADVVSSPTAVESGVDAATRAAAERLEALRAQVERDLVDDPTEMVDTWPAFGGRSLAPGGCPGCGNPLKGEPKFCPVCGTSTARE
jgi:hypothetical protein